LSGCCIPFQRFRNRCSMCHICCRHRMCLKACVRS